MPTWTQYVIGIAALVVASGVIWKKLIQPLAKLITMLTETMPVMEKLVFVFRDAPNAFKVLYSIQDQFKTDSGSSLRDAVNRIDAAALSAGMAAEVLKVGVEARKLLDEQDRARIDRLIVGLDRIERHAAEVAQDLADSHRRADEVSDQPHGAAADAAAQQTAKEKREG